MSELYPILRALKMGEGSGGGGGTSDYTQLSNKPQINSNELSGNKSSSDLGLQDALTEAQLAAVNSGVTSSTVEQVANNTTNISSLLNPINGSLTWAIEPTSSNVSIKQFGNIVYLQVYALFSADITASSEVEIGTIASVGKPATALRLTGGFAPTSLSDAPTALFQAFISASTNKLLLRTGATTGKAIYLNAAYVAAT